MTTCTLSSDQLRCVIRPDLGGAIQSLTYCGLQGDTPVLRAVPAVVTSAHDLASFPLVPFSNRIANAQLQWGGERYPLDQLGWTEVHAIHGVGWKRPWQVVELTSDFAALTYRHAADGAWPFAFDVVQTFQLRESTLEMTLACTNLALHAAPVGLGWHPYFAKRAGARLSFAATGRWAMGSDKLPTELEASSGLNVDCAALAVDHCFEGWGGTAELRDEQLCVRVSSSLQRLVVFTHAKIDSLALEPVSHVNNAMNAASERQASLGVQLVQPGEPLTAQMSITCSPHTHH